MNILKKGVAFHQSVPPVDNDGDENGFLRPLQNAPFFPISSSGSNYNPRNTQCIPVV
jgi:hypothetical protein